MKVTFFLDEGDRIEALRRLDPDRDWRDFQFGEHAWILQTYLRLARAGFPAELSATPPSEGIVVFHAKQARALRSQGRRLGNATLLGTRADNREPLIADFEVVQNGRFADGRRRFHIPHWPQPALIPRDPTRGATIRRIAFKGFAQNLHPDLRSPAWEGFLAGLGIEWLVDAVPFAGAATDRQGIDWPDFREVDLLLAMRPPDRRLWTPKPATKLYNAWLAGVPALLGPEHAYREQRRSELDYLEVSTLDEAKAAVLRLVENPGLYQAMVENGLARSREITPEATLPRWIELLAETLPARIASRSYRRLPLPLRAAGHWLHRAVTLRPAR